MRTTIYRTKTASEEQIASHLSECAKDFIPALTQRVNIAEYATKLFAKAVSFEAWNNEKLIGLIACYINPESGQAYITSVSVSNTFQGAGIAHQLLKNCLQHSEENNLKTIKLEVNEANIRAIRFYEKAGFKPDEKQNDSIFMSLTLRRF